MFFFDKNKKENLSIIFDIQSSVIRSALVSNLDSENPYILHSQIVEIPYRANSGSAHLVKKATSIVCDMLSSFQGFMSGLDKKKYHGKISNIHIGLSSPWVTPVARLVTIHNDKEIHVDTKFIKDVMEQERNKIHTDTSLLSPIEEKIFDVKLNGYSISDWPGKKAREIEVSYSTSYISKKSLEKLSHCCHAYVGKSKIHYHSSLLLQYIGLKNIFLNSLNYCIIYLHGELTDTLIVRDGLPVFFSSFPFGVETLLRKISKSANVDAGTAESILSLYIDNHSDQTNNNRDNKIISDLSAGWMSDLTKILGAELNIDISGYDIVVSSRMYEQFFISLVRETYSKSRVQSLSIDLVRSKVSSDAKDSYVRLLALYTLALNNIKD